MTALLFTVMFLQCLNTSLITVPLPQISDDLHITVSESSWLLLSYSLGTCALLLQFAKLSRNNRVKSFFLYGLIIFTLSSFVCFLAKDFLTLTVVRFIQGAAIAMSAATCPIIVVQKYPDHAKGSALGTMAAGTGLAMVLGPSLGGLLQSIVSWHGLFLINIPFAIIALVLSIWNLPADGTPEENRDPDMMGCLAWFAILFFGLIFLENLMEWGAGMLFAFGFIAFFAVLALMWNLSKDRTREPIISTDMVRSRAFILIASSAMFGSAITEGALYLLPYLMQISWNMGVTECGMYFCIVSAATFVSANLIGRYCDNHSSKGPVMGSFLCTIVFDIIFILIEPSWALEVVVLSACMVGLSFAVFETAQYLRMIRNTVAEHREEAATMITVLTYVGASLGLIVYSLTFNIAVPEAAELGIDQLSSALMINGFHATGLLGLILGITGLILASLVSGKERIED